MTELNRFNLRVYGICIQDNCLLITDEIRGGYPMTKLPGGGLEFGEGLEDGLKREWQEELQAEIAVGDIFFVNPFLVRSSFNPKDQVVCFYYQIKLLSEPKGYFTHIPMDIPQGVGVEPQSFRWLAGDQIHEDVFTFPSDKALAPKLKTLFL